MRALIEVQCTFCKFIKTKANVSVKYIESCQHEHCALLQKTRFEHKVCDFVIMLFKRHLFIPLCEEDTRAAAADVEKPVYSFENENELFCFIMNDGKSLR